MKTRQLKVFASLFLSVLVWTSSSFAIGGNAEPINENPLHVKSVKVTPYNVGPGAQAEVLVEFNLADKHKAYVDQFKLRPENPDSLKIDQLKLAPIFEFQDTFSKRMREAIKDDGTLRALIEFPASMQPGEQKVTFKLTYQACTKDHCLFPKTISIDTNINVSSGAVGPKDPPAHMSATNDSSAAAGGSGGFDQAMKRGWIFAFGFVFLAGILTSLTPCVYPLLPITLAVIGARSKQQTRLKSFSLSVSYVLGIAITYSILGVLAASTGAMFGAALSNVYIVTGIALMFVVMGLSMYGLFEIQAPAFIRNRLGSAQTGSGYRGAFLTGLVSGVVASPCIGPVLVTILTWIAATGSKGLGFGLLFTFAMGMGLLLILVGTFSHLLGQMPRSGPWMDVVKFVFGTTMVGMALFYLKPIYPTWLFHGLVGLAIILITSAYGAWEPNASLSQIGRLRKGVMLSVFAVGVLLFASSTLVKLGLPMPVGGGSTLVGKAERQHLPWKTYSEDVIAQAVKDGKPVLVDFYADWCAACKELEEYTFSDAKVEPILRDKFVLVRFDATENSPELVRLKEKYKVLGLPTLIFYDRNGQVRTDLTVTGFETAEVFMGRLEKAMEPPMSARLPSNDSRLPSGDGQ